MKKFRNAVIWTAVIVVATVAYFAFFGYLFDDAINILKAI